MWGKKNVNFHSETKGTDEIILGNKVLGEVALCEQTEPAVSLRDKGLHGAGNVPNCFSRYFMFTVPCIADLY